jgi:hypothetical protein
MRGNGRKSLAALHLHNAALMHSINGRGREHGIFRPIRKPSITGMKNVIEVAEQQGGFVIVTPVRARNDREQEQNAHMQLNEWLATHCYSLGICCQTSNASQPVAAIPPSGLPLLEEV